MHGEDLKLVRNLLTKEADMDKRYRKLRHNWITRVQDVYCLISSDAFTGKQSYCTGRVIIFYGHVGKLICFDIPFGKWPNFTNPIVIIGSRVHEILSLYPRNMT